MLHSLFLKLCFEVFFDWHYPLEFWWFRFLCIRVILELPSAGQAQQLGTRHLNSIINSSIHCWELVRVLLCAAASPSEFRVRDTIGIPTVCHAAGLEKIPIYQGLVTLQFLLLICVVIRTPQSPRQAPVLSHRAPISSHLTASVWVFHDVSQWFLQVFHDVSQCFLQVFQMFNNVLWVAQRSASPTLVTAQVTTTNHCRDWWQCHRLYRNLQ